MIYTRSEQEKIVEAINNPFRTIRHGRVNNYSPNLYQCVLDQENGHIYCEEGYYSPGGTWYPNNIKLVSDVSSLPFPLPLRFDMLNGTLIEIPTEGPTRE